MSRRESLIRTGIAAALLLWAAIILSAFYITQRPQALQVAGGIGATLWSLALWGIMLVDSAALGYWILGRIIQHTEPYERILLGTGLGLGALGFLGYALGAMGVGTKPVLASTLLALLLVAGSTKTLHRPASDLRALLDDLRATSSQVPAWAAGAVMLTVGLSFVLTLLPPADGFDGLLYHLALPEQLLIDGRILPHDVFQYWFPSLIEGDYLWAVGLASERTAQMIHWSFMVLTLGLVWSWSRNAFGESPAWWGLVVLISMPSLPWLAAWAYTDMALAWTTLSALYSIWRWSEGHETRWLALAGIFAGMAMGIKYTSFILPVTCAGFILAWERGKLQRVVSVLRFSLPALLAALPWYLRNWLVMGNPVYPFLFKGLYWDSFRTAWYGASGTGIGWNLQGLILLPLTITTGHRDRNFFDGRVGPLILMLLPVAIWVIWAGRSRPDRQRKTLTLAAVFGLITYAFWTLGVVETINLWQSRLLWPGLIPFGIPLGLAVVQLQELNLPRLRMDFILTTLIGLVVAAVLLDNTISLIYRRPLAYSLGMESRTSYFERIQPHYAQAMELVASTPANSYVYFMFEPRSYGMSRKVQPDAMNDNLMHDFYVSGTPQAVAASWRANGYTHILIYMPGMELGPDIEPKFQQLLPYLRLEGERGEYRLYSVAAQTSSP